MICTGPELRPFMEAQLEARLPAEMQFIGDWREGQVVACCGFAHYVGHDVEVFLAATGGLGRGLLRAAVRYAFVTLGVARATCRVADTNPWAKLMPRMGFVLEGRMRRGYDGVTDMLIFSVLKDEFTHV